MLHTGGVNGDGVGTVVEGDVFVWCVYCEFDAVVGDVGVNLGLVDTVNVFESVGCQRVEGSSKID